VSEVFEVDPSRPEEAAEAVATAAHALRAGRLVVFPTDTVYGIACRPDEPSATSRLFRAKRRPAGLNLPVLAHSSGEALDLIQANDAATRLASAFWPGPLTLVLPRAERSMGWFLGEETRTIGVRVPDHPLSLALLERAGPLAATSANISGSGPSPDPAALPDAFGEAVAVYVLVSPGSHEPAGSSSTVVDLAGDELRVLREGPIDAREIARVVGAPSERRRTARTNPHSVH
jgi:tRNA threonylcarbamoyl adenosine modification protein (Sua5/YciO/YrdC/YwlC family)